MQDGYLKNLDICPTLVDTTHATKLAIKLWSSTFQFYNLLAKENF
jgi:hypothetical protein